MTTSSPTERPFITYYGENKISPVAQNISDLSRHFGRREALYRHLGIAPGLVPGKSVIEFGPGGGHNALYTLSLNPSRYVLIDGNPTGIESMNQLLVPQAKNTCLEIKQGLIEEFQSDEHFDLVLCEGLIPTQNDPAAFAKHVGSFVDDRGLLVITCMDSVPIAPEILRKIAASLMMSDDISFEDKVAMLVPIFSSHLDTLKGISRPYKDWVSDVLVHEWVGPLFSIPQAITALETDFEAYGCSPHFYTDWRWYKDIWGGAAQHNELPVRAYYANVHNFLDYRHVLPPVDESINKELIDVCDKLYELHYLAYKKETKKSCLPQVMESIEKLHSIVKQFSADTATGIADCLQAFQQYEKTGKFGDFGAFAAIWGRGQQYISFIKKADSREP